jgi:hypothetical protein
MSENTTKSGASGQPAASTLERLGAEVPHADFWIFVGLLVLAIGGAAVSQVQDSGGRLYWLALVLVYGLVSVMRSWFQAKDQGGPVWPMIRAQVLHWLGAWVAIQIVLLFESSGMTDRGPAADYALLVLALSAFLAGVHFNWTFMLLGGILAVIAVALQELAQVTVYLVSVPLALLAIWVVYKRKFG